MVHELTDTSDSGAVTPEGRTRAAEFAPCCEYSLLTVLVPETVGRSVDWFALLEDESGILDG